MKKFRYHVIQIMSALLLLPFAALPGTPFGVSSALPSRAAAASAPITHVFVIVMENHSYSQVWGTSSTPYVALLGKAYARASNYYATAHPSLPNYLDMIAGSSYGITNDCSPSSSCHIKARSLADLLEAKGLRWRAYMESMPAPCGVKSSGGYAPKHNPFVYFDNIRNNSTRCKSHVVPFTAFASDIQSLARTPNFAFISPNLCNDMHDCGLSSGDNWLAKWVPMIVASPTYRHGHTAVLIVWDEGGGNANQVPLVVLSRYTRPGIHPHRLLTHYSLLRATESLLGIRRHLGKANGARGLPKAFHL